MLSSIATYRQQILKLHLIIDDTLNGDMRSYDVVQKIDMICQWFSNRNEVLPKHIEVVFAHIEKMQSYQELKALKGANANRDEIAKKYNSFLTEFSSDASAMLLLAHLCDEFKNAFTN